MTVTCCECKKQFLWNAYLTDEILNRPSREAVAEINYSKLKKPRLKLKVLCVDCAFTSKPAHKIRLDIKMNGG